MKILVINPGSTSTKIAVYDDETELFSKSIEHTNEDLVKYDHLSDQFNFRKEIVLQTLENFKFDVSTLVAVVGRGGLLPPVKAGGYLVNQSMKDRIINGPIITHPSNLGALIAESIAKPLGIPAYIYDAVSSDEFYEIARITGFPEISRHSFCHVLNAKAMARKAAAQYGKTYDQMNFIVAHLGGGISISIHEKGRIVDSISDDGGPFSPERSGSAPLSDIVELCYSGNYTKKEMIKKIRGMGGIKAHLGVLDCREIESRIDAGDQKAKMIFDAQAYQIAKGIGELAPVLNGKIDAIILTGGVAKSKRLTEMVSKRVKFIAPVLVLPGENEMESLALGALRILRGEETPSEYVETINLFENRMVKE